MAKSTKKSLAKPPPGAKPQEPQDTAAENVAVTADAPKPGEPGGATIAGDAAPGTDTGDHAKDAENAAAMKSPPTSVGEDGVARTGGSPQPPAPMSQEAMDKAQRELADAQAAVKRLNNDLASKDVEIAGLKRRVAVLEEGKFGVDSMGKPKVMQD